MTPAEVIVDRLGGVRQAARLLNRPPSTIQSWKTSGFIPARHQAHVLDVAKREGITITPADLMGVPVHKSGPSAGLEAPASASSEDTSPQPTPVEAG